MLLSGVSRRRSNRVLDRSGRHRVVTAPCEHSSCSVLLLVRAGCGRRMTDAARSKNKSRRKAGFLPSLVHQQLVHCGTRELRTPARVAFAASLQDKRCWVWYHQCCKRLWLVGLLPASSACFQPRSIFFCHHRRSFVPRRAETREEAGGERQAFRRIPFLMSSQFMSQNLGTRKPPRRIHVELYRTYSPQRSCRETFSVRMRFIVLAKDTSHLSAEESRLRRKIPSCFHTRALTLCGKGNQPIKQQTGHNSQSSPAACCVAGVFVAVIVL